ncbi:MAG: HEAT repeat protein [Hyphomicrobiaceae bacterium]|jgi:HEAT repeat protein
MRSLFENIVIMRRYFGTALISLAILGLCSGPVYAQISKHPAVKRYDRVARGSNVEEWQRRLLDPQVKIRLEAVDSLGTDGTEAAVPGLMDALADSDYRVRIKAIDYLGRIGDPIATAVLMQLLFLSEIDKPTKLRVLTSLGRIGDRSSAQRLLTYARTVDDDDLCSHAIFALGEIADPLVEEGLKELDHDLVSPQHKRLCADAIAKIKLEVATAPGRQPSVLELEKRYAPPEDQQR